jgi:cation transport protein ChaC
MTTSDQDIWIFGYGSLMWNPGFEHVERRIARVMGYHRRLCVYSHTYRGTATKPGLVLGLARGGSCRGVAYRVTGALAAAVRLYLDDREMIYEVYRPVDVRLRFSDEPDGPAIWARTYVVNPGHSQYAGALSDDERAALVIRGHGISGSARDYLVNTIAHLGEAGMPDQRLTNLLQRVQAIEAGTLAAPRNTPVA